MTSAVVSPLSLVKNPDGTPLVVWRGESSGEMFQEFALDKTHAGVGFFFAEDRAHAEGYARLGTEPRAFGLLAARVLDLRDPYGPGTRCFLDLMTAEFDDWTDRYSGEPMGVHEFLEGGSLYDYEGTGSAQRWNRLFELAWDEGYDAVAVLDSTDGVPTGTVWVVASPQQIQFLSPSPDPLVVPAQRRFAL